MDQKCRQLFSWPKIRESPPSGRESTIALRAGGCRSLRSLVFYFFWSVPVPSALEAPGPVPQFPYFTSFRIFSLLRSIPSLCARDLPSVRSRPGFHPFRSFSFRSVPRSARPSLRKIPFIPVNLSGFDPSLWSVSHLR